MEVLEVTHGPNNGPHSVIILAEGRLVNLGCNRTPKLGDVTPFTNQTLAQIELVEKAESIGKKVITLPGT